MPESDKEIAWSIYWSQDRLHSCVASRDADDQRVLDAEWARFASELPDYASVLDLATGNGAVPKALLASRSDLQIDAVDRAEIDPLHFLSDKGQLERVNFHPQTDILSMSFAEASFDAITSQFGIEYAGLDVAGPRIAVLLKPRGKMLFFVHHADSEIIQSSAHKKTELENLVGEQGLLNALQAMLTGNLSQPGLEQRGQDYLQGDFNRTEEISGQVFNGIEQVISLINSDYSQAMKLAASMDLRVRSEYQRLCQMIAAAQTQHSLSQFTEAMRVAGISVGFEPLAIQQQQSSYLLCWKLKGSRIAD